MAAARSHNCLDLCVDQCSAETFVALAELDRSVFGALREVRAPVHSAGASAAGDASAVLYSIRSERQLVERIEFDILFRWFVGLSIDEKAFDASSFSKNRDRLLTQEVAQGFLASLSACRR